MNHLISYSEFPGASLPNLLPLVTHKTCLTNEFGGYLSKSPIRPSVIIYGRSKSGSGRMKIRQTRITIPTISSDMVKEWIQIVHIYSWN